MPVRVCLCLCCAYLIFGGLFLQIGISTAVQHFMVPFLCSLCRSRSNSKFDQGLFIAAFTAEDRSKYAFSFLYIWPSLSVSPPLPLCSFGVYMSDSLFRGRFISFVYESLYFGSLFLW